MNTTRASVFLIVIAFSILFVLLYFAGQSASVPTKPKLNESDVRELIQSYVENHTSGLATISFAIDHPAAEEKHFPLLYIARDGIQSRVNNTDFTIIGTCRPSPESECPVQGEAIIDAISGKLSYLVELTTFTTDGHSVSHRYFVDADNGDVLYSS